MTIDKDAILAALSSVRSPEGDDIVARGMVSAPFITQSPAGAKVMFSLTVPADKVQAYDTVQGNAKRAVEALDGVATAMVVLTAERKAGEGAASAPPAPLPTPAAAAPPPPTAGPRKADLPHVRHIVAVASGKGGVGKSTTAVNLALALADTGLSVGILDADIYGPSLPRLLGLTGKPEADGRVLKPMRAHGLRAMSIGSLVPEESPMIWRGPMVISALTQLLREVTWGTAEEPLDILIVDMPPGTGDAQLTMAQNVPLAGAVIVSTPQDLALIDARKGLAMFEKVSVPILGIVENMSTFICPSCGTESHIFGHGGAEAEAHRLGVPFLGHVPLHMDIRSNSDAGTPVVASQPNGPHAAVYRAIAQGVAVQLDAPRADGPAIVYD
ncbi:Mrp/NBP35 family ATP-binding protein [Rhizobiaceae bacterium]|nr:Mrp/NBP35 family ATP-binding protein [Rhizobiaceae bacterium]